MKILVITDVHSNLDAARAAGMIEEPELVLDCGDHEEITNLFSQTPHFYIRGNHEPQLISLVSDGDSFPNHIPTGSIIQFDNGKEAVTFMGIDGNYGTKETIHQVNPKILPELKQVDQNFIDIMLLHESPLNVPKNSKSYPLAMQVLQEIERIKPKIVFSGHTNIYSEHVSDQGVNFCNLDDMCAGYGVIYVNEGTITFERRRAHYGR